MILTKTHHICSSQSLRQQQVEASDQHAIEPWLLTVAYNAKPTSTENKALLFLLQDRYWGRLVCLCHVIHSRDFKFYHKDAIVVLYCVIAL